VAVVWKKNDNSALGGTEGFVLGIAGDKISGEYLLLDRSTYRDSLKSVFFSLGILDLKVIPLAEIKSTKTINLRKRPPGVDEKLTWYMEIDYRSNVDYDETVRMLNQRQDCKCKLNQPSQMEGSCGMTIFDIEAIEGTKVLISPEGNVQIFCLPDRLDDCIKWLQGIVEIWPGHKHLVLVPTNFMFNIHDNFKGTAYPTEDAIDRIAATEGDHPIILSLGWVQEFFSELDSNPLQKIFPNVESIDELVLIRGKKRKINAKTSDSPVQPLTIDFPQRQVGVNRYLGANAPVLRFNGLIRSPEEEDGLTRFWLEDRSAPWQWMTLPGWEGKTIVRDLVIDRKNGIYSLDVQKYSGNEF